MGKPILCLDFDGVLHSYTSGWKGADTISDPPVGGAIAFLVEAVEHFEVAIFSSRSYQSGGIEAMKSWIEAELWDHFDLKGTDGVTEQGIAAMCEVRDAISWPTVKPRAMVTIDDRALNFDGTWPNMVELLGFKPWNKR